MSIKRAHAAGDGTQATVGLEADRPKLGPTKYKWRSNPNGVRKGRAHPTKEDRDVLKSIHWQGVQAGGRAWGVARAAPVS